VAVDSDKYKAAQKIRDYFKTPKWHALTKKQEKQYADICDKRG
jgi:hypothetical protein